MRAHFAGDIVVTACSPVEDEDDEERERFETHQQPPQVDANAIERSEPAPLHARIGDFKRDAKNMAELAEFIDEVLQKAETEAVKQQNAKNEQNVQTAAATPKEKRPSFAIPDFKNGKVVNRARGLVVRIFDAICNCANNAAAPAQRIKLRGKRSSTNSAKTSAGTENIATAGGEAGEKLLSSETKEKSKKLENGKEKKDDRKKEVQLMQGPE